MAPETMLDEDVAGRLVGQTYVSETLLIDQAMIDAFAETTLDRQFIHIDPERAAATPFGGTIAHGFLLLSLLPHLHAAAPRPAMPPVAMGINYGFDRVRFVRPVRAGSIVRARFTVAELVEKQPGRFQQTLDVELLVEGIEAPALVARWITQFVVAA